MGITKEEKNLINSGGENESFRVLLTVNKQDSLVLRQKSKTVDLGKDTDDLKLLIKRLKVTLEAEKGVGIAAPQVGILRNLFIIVRVDKPDMPFEAVINPQIISHPEETVCFENDGCLSIPEISGNSVRYPWILVEYFNENGEKIREKLTGHSRGDNFAAIIFQHEYDHLRGVLFIDKLCETSR
ncbi:MAG: peptide deformylase [Prevotellaceae bacterium]|jgi:peptide deformylase|nr:peptide deformylase [Prevotellaceae bacterium]